MPETTAQDVTRARGILLGKDEGSVTFGINGTDYEIHLAVYKEPSTEVGKRIIGTIRAEAQRIDKSGKGGRYIEPVYGRPRRIQGHVVDVNPAEQTVTIDATVPFVCKTNGLQDAGAFKVGDFVTCGLKAGASFTPVP